MRRYPIHDDFKRYARLIPPITRQTLPLLRAAQRLNALPAHAVFDIACCRSYHQRRQACPFTGS